MLVKHDLYKVHDPDDEETPLLDDDRGGQLEGLTLH
jgi:hypothetical protein